MASKYSFVIKDKNWGGLIYEVGWKWDKSISKLIEIRK